MQQPASSVLFSSDAYAYGGQGAPAGGAPANDDALQFYTNSGAAASTGAPAQYYGGSVPTGRMANPSGSMYASVSSSDFGSGPSYSPGFNWAAIKAALSGSMPDEPPLLEELGINFAHIKTKGVTVLNPLKPIDKHIMDDTDLAGPLIFCFLFGGFLMLSSKLQFGYVYGISFVGVVSMYLLLNLMSDAPIDIWRTASVLGYCLLPMVVLSIVSIGLNLTGFFGLMFATLSVCWCTYAAASMFTIVLGMQQQRALVAYPVGILYSLFALLAIF